MHAQVGIIGAGPAGLLLSHLLHRRGIHSIVLERSSREHVEKRVRAGVLEQGTVDTLCAADVGQRLVREGMVHRGIELRFGGAAHRIAFDELVPDRAITVYGQQEVVKDLISARLSAGGRDRLRRIGRADRGGRLGAPDHLASRPPASARDWSATSSPGATAFMESRALRSRVTQ